MSSGSSASASISSKRSADFLQLVVARLVGAAVRGGQIGKRHGIEIVVGQRDELNPLRRS
jgi:hypothetical protein